MIVVFGSINLDLVARVQRLPRPGETLSGISFATFPGGKGANQAVAARLAGADVAMVGAVGADALASDALSGLVAADVDIRNIARSGRPTGVALIHVDHAGQNSITVIAGANADARAEMIPESALSRGTTIVMQLESPLDAVTEVASRARARGCTVVLNAAPAIPLPESLIELIDVLIVNEGEAAALSKRLGMCDSPELFARSMQRRCDCAVVVTLGARGALAAAEGKLLRASAVAVDVIDTTGAGDAFVGALAAARDRGASWGLAVTEGIAAGSLACLSAGAQSALPSRERIQQLAKSVELTLTSQSLD